MLPLSHLLHQTRSLKRGDVLFQQGDEATAIYSIEKGRVRLVRRTFDGHPVLIHTALAGEFLAEASLFADTYHCDAVASEPSRVQVYPREAVLKEIRSNSTIAMHH